VKPGTSDRHRDPGQACSGPEVEDGPVRRVDDGRSTKGILDMTDLEMRFVPLGDESEAHGALPKEP